MLQLYGAIKSHVLSFVFMPKDLFFMHYNRKGKGKGEKLLKISNYSFLFSFFFFLSCRNVFI